MPQSNQRISEYVLDARIGGGTFGEVWRARHHVWTDQLVAIKIPTDPQYLRNLQREGAAIHGLSHPNIVRAIGFDPYADPAYLVMEYVPGVNLRQVVQQRPTIDNSVKILKQVLAGLAHAHAQGVVHRDMKPENILIHERAARDGYHVEGMIKITDFGLGRAAARTQIGSIAYSASLNDEAGREIAGTLDYMAPEQRAGAEATPQTDLYACGVILYELLTGERPAGTDLPSESNAKVPKHLDEAFKRSYARLDKRFASAEELARALSAATQPPRPAMASVVTSSASCPSCRRLVEIHDQFCIHCGVQLVASVRRCARCGAYPEASDRFCIFCGEGLQGTATAETVA
jgi:serine/threonine-protein kinase